jgi:hypothetical protein
MRWPYVCALLHETFFQEQSRSIEDLGISLNPRSQIRRSIVMECLLWIQKQTSLENQFWTRSRRPALPRQSSSCCAARSEWRLRLDAYLASALSNMGTVSRTVSTDIKSLESSCRAGPAVHVAATGSLQPGRRRCAPRQAVPGRWSGSPDRRHKLRDSRRPRHSCRAE